MSASKQSALRLGGIALCNGLVVVSSDNWAAAIRETDGTISVASGKKPRLPGTGGKETVGRAASGPRARVHSGDHATGGVPLIRGIGRFAESLLVLGLVKKRLPAAQLPFENRRVAAALAASMAGATAVRTMAPRSALIQESGAALAAFIPAMLSVRNSAVSGYHGAEHKVIGARERAQRVADDSDAARAASGPRAPSGPRAAVPAGNAAAAPKEHDRCGSNLVGPFLLASVVTNLLVRDRQGRKTPLRAAAAGAASLALALEAMRWADKHSDTLPARLMMAPGRAIQKTLTTSEPTPEQLEVGERALAELLRLEVTD